MDITALVKTLSEMGVTLTVVLLSLFGVVWFIRFMGREGWSFLKDFLNTQNEHMAVLASVQKDMEGIQKEQLNTSKKQGSDLRKLVTLAEKDHQTSRSQREALLKVARRQCELLRKGLSEALTIEPSNTEAIDSLKKDLQRDCDDINRIIDLALNAHSNKN